jgi:hypothetical protein
MCQVFGRNSGILPDASSRFLTCTITRTECPRHESGSRPELRLVGLRSKTSLKQIQTRQPSAPCCPTIKRNRVRRTGQHGGPGETLIGFDAGVEEELVHEQRLQRQQDREYWQPLKAELEQLRLNRRKQILTQFVSRLSKNGVGRVALSTTLVALAAASARVSATLADRRFTEAPLHRTWPPTMKCAFLVPSH